MFAIEIKLVLIWTRLLYIKFLIIIPKATTKKIIQKYIVKEMIKELKCYTRKYTKESSNKGKNQKLPKIYGKEGVKWQI